jgi:hypothetical protein
MQDQLDTRHLPEAVMANDRLLKALISLLVVERPERLQSLQQVFDFAERMHSPIAEMPARSWTKIQNELEIIGASFGPELH